MTDTYGDLVAALRKDLLLDATTDILPGTILASLFDQNGKAAFPQLPVSAKVKLAWGSSGPVAVPAGASFVVVTLNTTLPNVSNILPWYSIEPLGTPHSITSSEIGAFTASSVTVGVTSSVAQNVGVYAFAIGGA